jgi:hypothetical protein
MNPEYVPFENMLPPVTTYQFWVPEYQRAFVWESEHLHGLWRDLGELYRDTNESRVHFLGIVLQKVTSHHQTPSTRKELIDGQQRITTVLLLLAAIRDHIAETAHPPRKVKWGLDSLFFARDHVDKDKATEHPVLLLQRADQRDLERAVTGQWRKLFAGRKGWGRILRAYEYFRYCLWIGESSFDEVQSFNLASPKPSDVDRHPAPEKFWAHRRINDQLAPAAGDIDAVRLQTIVRSRLKFLCVTIDANDEDPVVVFDSINGKRMEFSQWDHAKTYFFRRIGDADQGAYEQWVHLEDRIAAFAKHGNKVRRSGAGLGEDLLYNFLITESRQDGERANKQRSAVQLRRLLLHLHQEREPTPAELVSFLKTRLFVTAEAFLYLAADTDKFANDDGSPLPAATASQISQIQAFSSGPPDPAVLAGLVAWRRGAIAGRSLSELLHSVEVFLARHFLAGRELSPLRSRFMQFLAAANKHSGDGRAKVAAIRDELRRATATDGDVRQWHCVERKPIYNPGDAARISAVFRGIEALRSGGASHPVPHGKGRTKFEVEHIFPQSCAPTPNAEWQSDLLSWGLSSRIAEFSTRCNCLGNLAMLPGYANQAAKDKGFERKKQALGKRAKGIITVPLSTSSDVLELSQWSPDDIDSRTDSLITDALNHWRP